MCWAPRWAGWSPRTSPILPGWPGWAPDRFRGFAARRDVRVSAGSPGGWSEAARAALPTGQAAIARQILHADLALLGDLDAQITDGRGPDRARCCRPPSTTC